MEKQTENTEAKTVDHVAKWLSSARNAEYGFVDAVVYALEQFGQKNNRPMYALIAFTNGKRFGNYRIEEGYKLTQFATPLRRVLNAALADTKFIFKDGTAKVKVGKQGGLNHDVLRELKAVNDDMHKKLNHGLGVKSEAFKEMFPVIKADKTNEQLLKSRLKTMKKFVEDTGMTRDEVLQYMVKHWNDEK